MLHPSASPYIKTEWVRSNDVELLKKDVDDRNKYFMIIYKTCTNLSGEEIKRVLYSNDNARYLTASEPENVKLSHGNASGIHPTPVSYYIKDDDN